MKINKKELQTALEKVKPGLANREILEQATSFAFMGDRVVTYNDEISVSHPVEGLNVTGAVKAQALYDFLNKIKKDEIEIEWQENQVVIKSGKAKAGLILEQEIKLPIEEVGEINKWKSIPEDMMEALKFCYPCCSKDLSRPILTCVNINKDSVEASDSYQIIRYKLNKKAPVSKFLVPASSVRELVKYKVDKIAEGQGWVHFKSSDDTIFSCRILNDEFPDVTNYLEFEGMEFDFPKKTTHALEKAEVFSKADLSSGDLPTVTIEITDGEVNVTTKNEYGWFEEKIKGKHSVQDSSIKFSIGINFLSNLLSQLQNCIVGEDRIKFEGENWTHVIAMMSE